MAASPGVMLAREALFCPPRSFGNWKLTVEKPELAECLHNDSALAEVLCLRWRQLVI